MCDCEEFEDYELLMSRFRVAEPGTRAAAAIETPAAPVEEPEPVPQTIPLKRRK